MQAYVATVPDLFSDERFTSRRFADGHQTDTHTTLSTFRVQRGSGPRQPGQSRKSRTVCEIDGAPAHGADHSNDHQLAVTSTLLPGKPSGNQPPQ